MHNPVRVRVVQPLTGLARNVLQVPDGKSFIAGQHGADAVALHVLHGGAELAFNFFQTIEQRDVVAVERLGAFSFLHNLIDQHRRLVSKHLQLDGLQRDRLSAIRVGSFVNCAELRMHDLAENLETPNLVGHCSLSPVESLNLVRKTQPGSLVESRQAPSAGETDDSGYPA